MLLLLNQPTLNGPIPAKGSRICLNKNQRAFLLVPPETPSPTEALQPPLMPPGPKIKCLISQGPQGLSKQEYTRFLTHIYTYEIKEKVKEGV